MPATGRSLALALVLALAFVVRFEGLDARTLTHPECYVPLLDFRPPFDSPAPRATLWETVQRTIDDDNHPPAQLVFMYAWNRAFGTGTVALRFPSVVFGVLGVLFTFLLARRTDGPHPALLAALLLALNGLHVFWSQHARIWVLVTAIAVASSWCLLRLLERPTRARAALYVLVCALGLWTEYYFWIFFLGHVAFALARALAAGDGSAVGPAFESRAARVATSAQGVASASALRASAALQAPGAPGAPVAPPPLLRLQAASLVLATPLAVFLWSHLTLRRHFVTPRTLPRLVEVAAGDGLADLGLAEHWLGAAGAPVYFAVAALGLVLLLLGVRRAPERAATAYVGHVGGTEPSAGVEIAAHGERGTSGAHPSLRDVAPRGLLALCAAIAALALGGMYAAGLAKPHWIAGALFLPFAALVLWRGVELAWPRVAPPAARALRPLTAFLARDLVATSFVVPLAVLTALSLAKPMLVARGLLILAPAASILLARAALSLRADALRRATVVLLVLVAALSAHWGKTRPNAPADFRALGRELALRTRPGEPIAVANRWFAQPVLYYVDQDRNPATTPEALEELLARDAGPKRFWLTLFVLEEEVTNDPAEVERMDARIAQERARLARYGYESEQTARAFGGAALRFVRRE